MLSRDIFLRSIALLILNFSGAVINSVESKKFMLNVQSNLNISEDTRAHLVQRAWASYLRAMFASNEFIYIN